MHAASVGLEGDRAGRPWGMNWLLMGVVGVAGVILTIVGVALLGTAGLGVLAVVALAALGLAIDATLARRSRGQRRADQDEDSALPLTHIENGHGRPLGDSPDLHDEIGPHDIPLENPARHEIERSRRAS
jgi:hypothetical protein